MEAMAERERGGGRWLPSLQKGRWLVAATREERKPKIPKAKAGGGQRPVSVGWSSWRRWI
jgi:hypothetical protein